MSCPDCDRQATQASQRALKTARGGAPEPQIIKARREVCRSCPNAVIAHGDMMGWANFSKCRLCDCNIAEKTKNGAAECPEKTPKWTAVNAGLSGA
jgi:hypothetical protein